MPGKNLREVNGKPLIVFAIECGLRVPAIDRLIVSTDSERIARVARQWNAEVPFMRPAELAGDEVPMLPVMQHALREAEKIYRGTVETLVLLDPTAPLRTVDDVDGALALFHRSDCDAVISGNSAHRSPYFNMVVPDRGYMRLAIPSEADVGRRQDSPPVYDLNTVVWIYCRDALMVEQARIPQKTLLYEVPAERAIDLDTELDFRILEAMLTGHQEASLKE